MDTQARTSTLYSPKDYACITDQIKRRWLLLALPCIILLAVVVGSFIIRVEWLTTTATILIGVLLIAGYDLAVKPLVCYRRHLYHVLYGRVRETDLPFVAISEDVNLVDGVACRAMTCQDVDGKGRPYDRLFYFDCEKTFPDFQPGDMLHLVHHDLTIADLVRIN